MDARGDILIFSRKRHFFSSVSKPALSPTIPLFWGYGRLSQGGERPGLEADYLTDLVSWLRMIKSYTSTAIYAFIVDTDKFAFPQKQKWSDILCRSTGERTRVCVCACVTENAKSYGQSRIIFSSWRHPLTSFPWPDMAAACSLIGKSILCVQVPLYGLWQQTALIPTGRFVKWTPRLAGQVARMGRHKTCV
jgi:hypothetical protein